MYDFFWILLPPGAILLALLWSWLSPRTAGGEQDEETSAFSDPMRRGFHEDDWDYSLEDERARKRMECDPLDPTDPCNTGWWQDDTWGGMSDDSFGHHHGIDAGDPLGNDLFSDPFDRF